MIDKGTGTDFNILNKYDQNSVFPKMSQKSNEIDEIEIFQKYNQNSV